MAEFGKIKLRYYAPGELKRWQAKEKEMLSVLVRLHVTDPIRTIQKAQKIFRAQKAKLTDPDAIDKFEHHAELAGKSFLDVIEKGSILKKSICRP